MKKRELNFNKLINETNLILEEKSMLIKKLENHRTNNESKYNEMSKEYQMLITENEKLRKNIAMLESRMESDKLKFKELWETNVQDFKTLQATLNNNEKLLSDAIKREEKLQHKYCVDIENAVKLNKQLNLIICKKNKILADVKIKQQKVDEEKSNEHKKLYKENAALFNDYAKILELKEREKKQSEDNRLKLLEQAKSKIEILEEEKNRSEYKVKLLKNENKNIFDNLLAEIKNKNNN